MSTNPRRRRAFARGSLLTCPVMVCIASWYEAFGVTPADAMYLAPEQRLSIW